MVADGNEGKRVGWRRQRLPSGSNPIDIHLGNQLLFCRILLGYSPESLCDEVSLKFQKVLSYQRGANCIGAAPLYL